MSGARQRRDVLLILLAVTTGATDAGAFDRLGHVFTSVITGNLVLIGVGAAGGDGRLALLAGCALIGFAAGVLLGAPRGSGVDRGPGAELWPPGASLALGLDLVALGIFALGWELADGRPGAVAKIPLIVIASLAMGIQSTAVRRLGEFSTTYLTSTLTGLLEAVVARRFSRDHIRSVGILAMALIGAAAAIALIATARRLLPVLQLLPLATVIACSRPLIGLVPDEHEAAGQ